MRPFGHQRLLSVRLANGVEVDVAKALHERLENVRFRWSKRLVEKQTGAP